MVWDLATGQPVGAPFAGDYGVVYAIRTAQLHGRPVVISGGDDETVGVWDLAARPLVTNPRPTW